MFCLKYYVDLIIIIVTVAELFLSMVVQHIYEASSDHTNCSCQKLYHIIKTAKFIVKNDVAT